MKSLLNVFKEPKKDNRSRFEEAFEKKIES